MGQLVMCRELEEWLKRNLPRVHRQMRNGECAGICDNELQVLWEHATKRPAPCGKYILSEDFQSYTKGGKVILANGCFDMLSAGHVHTLQWAREQGDFLVVAVNDDDSVRRLKGEGRPLVSLPFRMSILAALECVNFVIRFGEDTPERLLEIIDPDVVVKGPDYTGGYDAFGWPLLIAPPCEWVSHTTDLARVCIVDQRVFVEDTSDSII